MRGGKHTPARPTGVPTAPTEEPSTPPTSSPTPVGTRNTLAIKEPSPNSTITDTVEVKGEGMAFENMITAEVVANGPRGNATVVDLLDLVELRDCVIAHEASYGVLSVREVIVHQMQTRARL